MFCLRIAVVLTWNLGGPRVLYCLNVYVAPRFFYVAILLPRWNLWKLIKQSFPWVDYGKPHISILLWEYKEEGVSCEPERGSSLDAEPWSSYQSWENFFSVVCKPPALCCFDERLNEFVEELRTTEFRALSATSTIAGCSQRHPFPSVFRYGHVLDGKYDVWEFIVKWRYSTSVLWIRHGWSLEGLTMPDQRGRTQRLTCLGYSTMPLRPCMPCFQYNTHTEGRCLVADVLESISITFLAACRFFIPEPQLPRL